VTSAIVRGQAPVSVLALLFVRTAHSSPTPLSRSPLARSLLSARYTPHAPYLRPTHGVQRKQVKRGGSSLEAAPLTSLARACLRPTSVPAAPSHPPPPPPPPIAPHGPPPDAFPPPAISLSPALASAPSFFHRRPRPWLSRPCGGGPPHRDGGGSRKAPSSRSFPYSMMVARHSGHATSSGDRLSPWLAAVARRPSTWVRTHNEWNAWRHSSTSIGLAESAGSSG
jgi:hypothetical protein